MKFEIKRGEMMEGKTCKKKYVKYFIVGNEFQSLLSSSLIKMFLCQNLLFTLFLNKQC